ncbi:MAG TPA: c-type cytochrome domain-containing protein, partial [Phenylobacterium sp.]|nr:c-type cytochrome domain-containing protein [Phenylobacterium sp.]
MVLRRYLVLVLLALVAFGSLATAQAGSVAAPTPASSSPDGTVLSKYCFGCHNSKSRVGGLALDTKDLTHVSADAEVWEKVVRKLRMGAMPPLGRPRPDNQAADAF